MVFAISRGVSEAGFAFSVSMFLGVSAALVGVALIAAFAREQVIRLMQMRENQLQLALRTVDLLSDLALLTLSLWEMSK